MNQTRERKHSFCGPCKWAITFNEIDEVVIFGELVGPNGALYEHQPWIQLNEDESVKVTLKDKKLIVEQLTNTPRQNLTAPK